MHPHLDGASEVAYCWVVTHYILWLTHTCMVPVMWDGQWCLMSSCYMLSIILLWWGQVAFGT